MAVICGGTNALNSLLMLVNFSPSVLAMDRDDDRRLWDSHGSLRWWQLARVTEESSEVGVKAWIFLICCLSSSLISQHSSLLSGIHRKWAQMRSDFTASNCKTDFSSVLNHNSCELISQCKIGRMGMRLPPHPHYYRRNLRSGPIFKSLKFLIIIIKSWLDLHMS